MMERVTWRYRPEFILSARVNGEPARDMEWLPAAKTPAPGMIIRSSGATLTCFGRRHWNGTDWDAAYPIGQPLALRFWIRVLPGGAFPIPSLFSDPESRFGKPVFYADNLSPSGEIDALVSDHKLKLIPDPSLIDESKAALSTYTPAAKIVAGDYTAIKAGKILPGAAVAYPYSEPIDPTQTVVALDLRFSPEAVFQVVLEGASPLQERVIPDESALAAGVDGVVTIYKDAWRAPGQPIEYSINFIT